MTNGQSGNVADLTLRPATIADKPMLWRILGAYISGLSQYGAIDQTYPYFDLYWTEPDRQAYLAEVRGRTVGFALVNRHSPSGLGTDRAIAEFGIVPDMQGRGMGRAFAHLILSISEGVWELSVLKPNRRAVAFWVDVAASFPPVDRSEIADEIILRFDTRAKGEASGSKTSRQG